MDSLSNDLLRLTKRYLASDQLVFLFEKEDVRCSETMEEACRNRDWNSIWYYIDHHRYKSSYLKQCSDQYVKVDDIEMKFFFEYLYFSKAKYSGRSDKRFFVQGCQCNELHSDIDCSCIGDCDFDCLCLCHKCDCDDFCHYHPKIETLKALGIRTNMTAEMALGCFRVEMVESNFTMFSKLSSYMQKLYECACDCRFVRNSLFYGIYDRYEKLYDIILDHYIYKYKLYNFDKDEYMNTKLERISDIAKPPSKKDVIAFYKKCNNL